MVQDEQSVFGQVKRQFVSGGAKCQSLDKGENQSVFVGKAQYVKRDSQGGAVRAQSSVVRSQAQVA